MTLRFLTHSLIASLLLLLVASPDPALGWQKKNNKDAETETASEEFRGRLHDIVTSDLQDAPAKIPVARAFLERLNDSVPKLSKEQVAPNDLIARVHALESSLLKETLADLNVEDNGIWSDGLNEVVIALNEAINKNGPKNKPLTDDEKRALILKLLTEDVKKSLIQMSSGDEIAAEPTEIESRLTEALDRIEDKKKQKSLAKSLATRIQNMSRSQVGEMKMELAVIHLRSETAKIINDSFKAKEDSALRKDLLEDVEAILGMLKTEATTPVDGKTQTEVLLDSLRTSVLPTLASRGDVDLQTSRFGLTEFVFGQGTQRYIIDLELDVERDKTAVALASINKEASSDVVSSSKSKSALDFAEDIQAKMDKQLTRVNSLAPRKPWASLREGIGLKLRSLSDEGDFDSDSKADWSVAFHEIAVGYQKLGEFFGKSPASESTPSTTLTSPFSTSIDVSALAPGSAYELKMKLEIRRELYRLQRKMVEEEFDARRKLAKIQSKEKRKLAEDELEQTLKEYREKIRKILQEN